MTAIAPTLQAFFTERLIRQRGASPRTIASYRDTLRLLLAFATPTPRSETRVRPGFMTTRRPTTRRDHHPGGATICEERPPSRSQFR